MGPDGGDRPRPHSPGTASPRSFFKIILPSVMLDHKLRIPEDFAKHYWDELSTSATFTARSGQVWHLGVEKANKILWFTDGWKEFAEHYSIKCGFFVVFNYEGISKFNVLIFDLTATEIHNSRNNLSISQEPPEGGNQCFGTPCCSVPRPVHVISENKTFDEFLYQRIGGRRLSSLGKKLFEFAPEFSLRINKHGRCVSSLKSMRSEPHYCESNKRHKMEDQVQTVKLECVTDEANACEMPNSRKSSLDKPEKENVEDSQGRFSSGSKLKNLISGMGNDGYYARADSVLIQEAVRRSKDGQQLKVNSQGEKEVEFIGVKNTRNFPMRQLVRTQEREKAVNAAMMYKPKNPFFMIILRPYNVQNSYILNVPSRFAKKYTSEASEFIKLEVSGRKHWTVRCIPTKGYSISLSKGWSVFVKDNNLGEGDVCVFELVRVEDIVLKVSIFRACEEASEPT